MGQSNVCECVLPLLKISAIFGLLLAIKEKNILLAQPTWLRILIPITYLGITTLLVYEVVQSTDKQEKSKYGIGVLYIGVLFIFIGNIMALYIIFITNIFASAAISKIVNEISKIDELMTVMIHKINYKLHFKQEVCVIVIGLFGMLAQIVLHYQTFNNKQKLLDKKMLFLLAFPLVARMVIEIQYVLLIKLLHERFIILNNELHSIFEYNANFSRKCNIFAIEPIKIKSWKEKINEEPVYIDGHIRNIKLLMDLHDKLSEVGHTISRVFSLQMLACIATHLINEIFTVFYTYFEMIYRHYIPALHWFGWVITINIEMLQITLICHKTANEASKTASLINKLFLLTHLNKAVKEELFIFSQQIQHRPLQFSACGLFIIDGRLLFMVTCALSTYLLMMIQYQEGIEMHCLSRQ